MRDLHSQYQVCELQIVSDNARTAVSCNRQVRPGSLSKKSSSRWEPLVDQDQHSEYEVPEGGTSPCCPERRTSVDSSMLKGTESDSVPLRTFAGMAMDDEACPPPKLPQRRRSSISVEKLDLSPKKQQHNTGNPLPDYKSALSIIQQKYALSKQTNTSGSNQSFRTESNACNFKATGALLDELISLINE